MRNVTIVSAVLCLALCRSVMASPTGRLFVFGGSINTDTGAFMGSGNVLAIDLIHGSVSITISLADIVNTPGRVDLSFRDNGIVADADGNVLFSVEDGTDDFGQIMKRDASGNLAVLASPAAIKAATLDSGNESRPERRAIGSEPWIFANDDASESVIKVEPDTGMVKVHTSCTSLDGFTGIRHRVDRNRPIAASPNGIIYTVTDDPLTDSVNAMFKIAAAGTPSVLVADPGDLSLFGDLDVFMTTDPRGDLIIADGEMDMIFRVTQDGVVSAFLSEAQLESVAGQEVDLEGGLAFDHFGNFYVAEGNTDSILKFDPDLLGSIFATAADMEAVTGSDPDLDGGMAFVIPERVSL